jgi:hypothetical protein
LTPPTPALFDQHNLPHPSLSLERDVKIEREEEKRESA